MKLAPKRIISVALSFVIAFYGTVAQSQPASAVARGADFTVTVSDLQFILQQIRIAESHRAIEGPVSTDPTLSSVTPSTNVLANGRALSDPRPGVGNTTRAFAVTAASTRVLSPLLPEGLRQVDGRNNNLTGNGFSSWMGFGYITPIPNQGKSAWGAADMPFPRILGPVYRSGYENRSGNVTDAAPRVISNLISDQSVLNPAARAAASCAVSGPNACVPSTTDGVSLLIRNRATNGVAAPYNGMFALFGQFFDHGLDLVGKSSTESVKIPLATTDPLYNACQNLTNRGCIQEISMGRTALGNDPTTAGTNTTTPWIDQNQTYTSHPSHQVFLREYYCRGLETPATINSATFCTSANPPIATGKLLDGDIAGNIANWSEIKRQAANKLGIELVDMDIHNVPLLLTDEYGRFLRSSGFPQVVTSFVGTTANVRVGNPGAPVKSGLGTGHAFLDDIAHTAKPTSNNVADTDTLINNYAGSGFYDDELLDAHFITGDGRGNENIGLTAIHTVFHAEHNRLWSYLQGVITDASTTSTGLSATALADFKSAWRVASSTTSNPNPEWNGERLFHASKLITEMEYQHLVFGEFSRKVQPLIKPFAAYDPTIRPDISGEFAHAVYRYGHSQLNETVDRTSSSGSDLSVPLLYAFLNPTEFNQPHDYLTDPRAPQAIGTEQNGHVAAGSIIRGMANQTGNEIDEFVTGALRNSLLGLPLDLATLNIARGRDAGISSLNAFRTSLKSSTGITSLSPYTSWVQFGQNLRHPQSLVNFIAAYGKTSGSITFLNGATPNDLTDRVTVSLDSADNSVAYTDKRAAAQSIVDCYEAYHGLGTESCENFMLGTSGLNDIDLWIGGLAEKNTQAGTMLGNTFDYVFKKQMEKLQESDRFYYLGRLAGLNLTVQVETNFFSDIIMRNTDVTSITTDAFAVPTHIVNMGALPVPSYIRVLGDGTWMYSGAGHILWNGTIGNDKILSDTGDDSIYGDAGNDWLRGGDGDDFIQGGEGRDVIEDSAGINILIGGNGNDYMSGSGTDTYNGNAGDDFLHGGIFSVVALAGIGNDWVRGSTDNDTLSGDDGNDWLEGSEGADLVDGDVVGPAGVTLAFPGNDILIGNSGNDLLTGFDGADIYVPGDGTDLNTGGLGFDWVTYFNDGQTGGVNEDLSNFAPAPGLVLANLADQFQEIEGLSGGSGDDILGGTSVTTLGGTASNGLSATDCALITGLTALLPSTITNCVWNAGDILIGGAGSDEFTGRNGNDLIDGDAVLQTWISIPISWGIANEAPSYVSVPSGEAYVASIASISEYIANNLIGSDVISSLRIVRLIAQTGHTTENDVAVFQAARANYTITVNANGTITVVDPRNGGATTNDGTDTLRNIEILRFTDGDVLVSSLPPSSPVLALSGLVGGAGSIAVTWSAPLISGTAPITSYTARAWTSSLRTGTPVGTCTTADGTTLTCTINSTTGAAANSGLLPGNYFVDVLATTTVNGSPSAAVGAVTVQQAPASAIAIRTPASGAVNGRAFSTQPVIEIRNALGGVVTNSTATVTATVASGATVVGSTTAVAVAGVARFLNLGISGTAGTPYTVTYTITSPSTMTTTEQVTPTANGASVNLAVGINIAGATSGVAATTQPVINITDANAGIITSDSTSVVTVSITGPGTPSVSGKTTATAASGVATFSGLIITGTAGSTYTLRYSLSTGEFTTEAVTLTSVAQTPIVAQSPPSGAASGVSVVGGTGRATVTWNAVAGASRYTAQVFSSPTSTRAVGQCSVRGNGGGSSFSCTISSLTRNFTYYVDVVTRNSAGAINTASRLPVTIL
jgi:Ca2+-binding RTX toxin-like protein